MHGTSPTVPMTCLEILLIVEDDPHSALLRAFLADNLAADGYRVRAQTAEQAEALAAPPGDLVLCDLPAGRTRPIDRLGPLAARLGATRTPLIVLASPALGRTFDLEKTGATLVIAKPFSYPELRGHITRLTRQAGEPREREAVEVGPLRIDRENRQVTAAGAPVELAANEYDLLLELAANPQRVYTKAELLSAVWGHRAAGRQRLLDSTAVRLRRKLERAAPGARLVVNVWGVGYRLTDTQSPTAR